MKHQDWDVLIIFDAMRWHEGSRVLPDYFSGYLTKINTGCSTTFQWYKKHWQEPQADLILISENPQPWHKNSNLAYKNFHLAYMSFGDSWLAVNPPHTWQLFLDLYKQNPKKRFLVHFLPPHLPYFTGAGADLMDKLKFDPLNIYEKVQVWGQKNGFDHLRKYYREQIVGLCELLTKDLWQLDPSAKLVISADHGELIGFDNSVYNHPPNPVGKQQTLLYEVPWLEVDLQTTLVEQRLKMLGYMSDE